MFDLLSLPFLLMYKKWLEMRNERIRRRRRKIYGDSFQ